MRSAERDARYCWAAQTVPGLSVLDAGCGEGWGAEVLARAGAEEVVGLDIVPEAVSTAMERFESVATFTLGDVTSLPFDAESFDVAVGFNVIEYVDDQQRALEELRRVLRPEGMLLMSTGARGDSTDTGEYHLTSCELSERLRRLFAHVRMFHQSEWFMTALMEDSDPRSPGSPAALPVELRDAAGQPVDGEFAALAVASNATLTRLPPAVAVACDPGGPEDQSRQNSLLRLELERAIGRERALRCEHAALGERLWEAAEGNQAELARVAADLDRARRSVVAMQASFSWRVTRPLRGFKGLLRRGS